ncbi:MAG TPA: hypothetical protein VGQ57_15200 [Polyangiaceae bacterium]|nr:hypothetical protein [Polyangiaceae bacterium]
MKSRAAWSVFFAGSVGCAAPALPAAPPAGELPRDLSPGQAGCRALKSPMEPKLTAWDPDQRAQINALRQQGVVAVRYAVNGCNVELEVLPNCVGKGAYAFSAYAESRRDYVENEHDLFAELPLGAARLSGKLSGNRVLRTDYLLVGVAQLPSNDAFHRESLAGPDCARATHVVARMYLGGFVLAAGNESTLKAEASLFGAGAGGDLASKIERVWSGGIPSACTQAQQDGKESPQCSVPLQIGLLPLGETKPTADRPTPAASVAPATPAAGAAPSPPPLPPGALPVPAVLKSYYHDLNARTFDAARYFAPSVRQFIGMKATTPQAIDRYIHTLFPKQYESYEFFPEDDSVREYSPEAITFVERARFYQVSERVFVNMASEVVVELDPTGKIVELRYIRTLLHDTTPSKP